MYNSYCFLNVFLSVTMYNKLFSKGLEFSKDGKYLAVAERRNYKDFISIFACDTWAMLKVIFIFYFSKGFMPLLTIFSVK